MPRESTYPRAVDPITLGIAGLTVSGLSAFIARELFRDNALEVDPIARVTDGRKARIVGRVVDDGEMTTAPFSGRRCAAYIALAYARDGERRRRVLYEKVAREFIVEDPTGRARVRVADTSSMMLSGDRAWDSPFDEEITAALASRPQATLIERVVPLPVTSCLEAVLEPGELVEIAGEARVVSGGDPAVVFDSSPIFVGDRSAHDRLGKLARRSMRGMAARAPSDFREGERTKVVGVVEPIADALLAPGTGRPCCAYEIVFGYEVSNALAVRHAFMDRQVRSFVLRCDDGTAVHVETPAQAATWLVNDVVEEGFARLPDGLASQLASKLSADGLVGSFALREGALIAGERAAVIGVLAREADPERRGSYRDGEQRWVLRSDDEPLFVSDDPRFVR